MTFLRKKTFLLFASSIAVLFFSFLITNSSLAQTSSCGDITNEFDCSIKNGIWDQNNSTCSDCITADTGGGGAAGNGGGGEAAQQVGVGRPADHCRLRFFFQSGKACRVVLPTSKINL
jgi:hypothetical protein